MLAAGAMILRGVLLVTVFRFLDSLFQTEIEKLESTLEELFGKSFKVDFKDDKYYINLPSGIGIDDIARKRSALKNQLNAERIIIKEGVTIEKAEIYKYHLKETFNNCKLFVEDDYGNILYPELLDKTEEEFYVEYVFKIPPGLELDDFLENEQAIAHQLEGETKIWAEGLKLYIKVFTKQIPQYIDFDIPRVMKKVSEKTLGMYIGYSRRGDIVHDFAEIPHGLVGGPSGSGKSTLLNISLLSLVLNFTPQELQIIGFDLKRGVELQHLEDLPHIKEIIIERHESIRALGEIVSEMERRYDKLKEAGVSDIQNYTGEMPYWIVVFDEYASFAKTTLKIKAGMGLDDLDLDMDGNLKDMNKIVWYLVHILSSKARACGIHLLIATQRPKSDIIDTNTKSNLLMRFGLKTISKYDSQTILDTDNLKRLPERKGRGIYKIGEEIETQVPYISKKDTQIAVKLRSGELSGELQEQYKLKDGKTYTIEDIQNESLQKYWRSLLEKN